MAYFPRGLYQPPGAYRFGAEALLLSCLLHAPAGALAADLGSGCGAAGLGLALRSPGLRVVAFEMQAELCVAAAHNARLLDLADRFAVVRADLAAPPLAQERFDLALANPPFHRPGAGRLPQSRLRREALFEKEHGLEHFCRAAALGLKIHGRLGLVFSADRLNDLLCALGAAGLEPSRLLPVAARAGQAPMRVLVEAIRPKANEPVSTLQVKDPLILHDTRGGRFSDQALAFCPFLA